MKHIDLVLAEFSFTEKWDFLLLLILLTITYFYMKQMRKVEVERKKLHQLSFVTAIVLYFVVHGTPFHLLAHHFLFLFKMIHESITYFAMPLLLIASMPAKILRSLLWDHRVRKIVLLLTNPAGAMVFFYSLYVIYHLPSVFALLMEERFFGMIAEALLFISAILMWWSIISPLPGINQLSDFKKLIYAMINSVLLFLPFYPLVTSEIKSYTYLGHGMIEVMTDKTDYQLGVAFIVVYQKLIVCGLIGVALYKWFNKENKIDAVDLSNLYGSPKDVHKK